VGTNATITIPSVAGENYQLQFRNSMSSGTWSNVAGTSVSNAVGSTLTLTNIGGGSATVTQRFYRFDITY